MLQLANPPDPQWVAPDDSAFDVSIMIGGAAVRTTIVATDPNFADGVLVAHSAIAAYQPPPPPTVAQLVAYASNKRLAVEQGVASRNIIIWNLAPEGQPAVNVEVTMTDSGQIKLNGAVTLTYLDPTATISWLNSTGPIALSATQVQQLAMLVAAFVQATYATLAAIEAAIEASPATVTTFAQIDAPAAPLPAWPTN